MCILNLSLISSPTSVPLPSLPTVHWFDFRDFERNFKISSHPCVLVGRHREECKQRGSQIQIILSEWVELGNVDKIVYLNNDIYHNMFSELSLFCPFCALKISKPYWEKVFGCLVVSCGFRNWILNINIHSGWCLWQRGKLSPQRNVTKWGLKFIFIFFFVIQVQVIVW